MVFFGDIELFAIEAKAVLLEDNIFLGQLQFSVDGYRLGDMEDTSDLGAAARWGRTFLKAQSRQIVVGNELSSSNLLQTYIDRYIHGTFQETWNRDPFLLNDIGEASLRDRADAILVWTKDGERLIGRDLITNTVISIDLPRGYSSAVVMKFCNWVEEQMQQK